MKFTRLRLVGFKSFVEPVELEIEPGLTGVVGPNGCGKSNLVEALRWVMGESSHKNMRASEMDDVIFSGTNQRPPRSFADVTLHLDNSRRQGPADFSDADTLEVSRRIERQGGSAYRINGRDVRARDVQLLFADASTGARSPALVRQGQINELINAKPESRRRILEEAAGITGLHTRRHEAELRLTAAESNLTRLDDVLAQLESQLGNLKRQARQAQRYKLLSAEIRRLEAGSLYRTWAEANAAAAQAASVLHESVEELAERTQLKSVAERRHTEAVAAIPELRTGAAMRSAVVQRFKQEQQELGAEEQRTGTRKRELDGLLLQLLQDREREREIVADSNIVLERLTDEEETLHRAATGDTAARERAGIDLKAKSDLLAARQEAVDDAGSRYSDLTARNNALAKLIADTQSRRTRLERQHDEATAGLRDVLADDGAERAFAELSAELAHFVSNIEAAEQIILEIEKTSQLARQAEASARARHEEARRRADTLTTEVRTLTKLLKRSNDEQWPSMLEQVRVESGYENALAAALGEDLDAATDKTAPVHWADLPRMRDVPTLPSGTVALAFHVRAPDALSRSLDAIAIVRPEDGPRLQQRLQPGQCLVSREGHIWRWDGYTASAGAGSAAAMRLAERNRLSDLTLEAEEAEKKASEARAVFDRCRGYLDHLRIREQKEREGLRNFQNACQTQRAKIATAERRLAESHARRNALEQTAARLSLDLAEATTAASKSNAELDALERPDTLKIGLEDQRRHLEHQRLVYSQARTLFDGLEREARLRSDRLKTIARECEEWHRRTAKAEQQIASFDARIDTTREALAEMSNEPARIEAKRLKLMNLLQEADAAAVQAMSRLATAEIDLRALDQHARTATEALAAARERHGRQETLLDALRSRAADCATKIAETFDTAPEGALRFAGVSSIDEVGRQEELSSRLATLKTDRERLGAVNLRAEEESHDVETALKTLVTEREDVIEAIFQKLRQAIHSLNREGRQRLLDAFDIVKVNFAQLFTTLFGGGSAELALIESDDPLKAGLEIIANPPGKRPQVLSLLSGGEQALTAVALIFAVFLTNPSPICVMDEVDAPLDDANVERFCNLLDAMLERAETRFLIITHHPVTMARMHRLFGVTMMERGVSQLVSVDLQAAEALREAG